ncbi:MAG TPA: hypothetical protein VFB32_06355 [Rudaea sp.]|nr:hypothetical protein [Rudaea sp.]
MKTTLIALSLAMASATAAADSAVPQAQPLAPSPAAKSAAAKSTTPQLFVAPTIHETRVTRRADGSLAVDCVQKPNPKLNSAPSHARSPQAGGADRP